MKNHLQAIVLAAGKASRFNTNRSKLAEPICGQPMILFITKLLETHKIDTTVVVGYEKNTVESIIRKQHGDSIQFALQKEQLGTGHALLCTKELWNKKTILVINGDMPLIDSDTITRLYEEHIKENAAISFVTSCDSDANTTYGRVVKTQSSISIIEAKDFSGDPQEHCCINAGIYLIEKDFLENYIEALQSNNANNEFYITDLVAIASNNKKNVTTISAPFDVIRGVNTLQELWAAEQIKRSEIIQYWMENGVRFNLAQNIHIDLNVTIGQGSSIGSGVHLFGNTIIGKNCHIKEFSCLKNSVVDDNSKIHSHSIINDSHVLSNSHVGPFAHIRNNTVIGEQVEIGNFVEIKNSTIGSQTKAKHLTYLGDATIGSSVNIGAGTITCNYNGIKKEKTTINDGSFIGSNNTLIAPITIGKNCFTAAGSTITQNVPDNALAIGRATQVNKENYALKLLQRNTATQPEQTKPDANKNNFSFVGARIINYDTSTDEQ